MSKPVLDGELAPNVAIQFRLRVLQIQDEVDLSCLQYKEYPTLENYQNYYGWIGVLISRMSSAPVFKTIKSEENKLIDLRKKYKGIKNSLTDKIVPKEAFDEIQFIQDSLEEIISKSPIYDFEFARDDGIELKSD